MPSPDSGCRSILRSRGSLVTIGETISTPRRDIAKRTELCEFLLIFLADVLSARTTDRLSGAARESSARLRVNSYPFSGWEIITHPAFGRKLPNLRVTRQIFTDISTQLLSDWCGGG